MAKLFVSVVVFALFAYCTAEPARFRTFRTNRFSARQEVASNDAAPAKAPYPPAGLKPDIPFDLPTETTTTPPQPDNTYLPPESVPDSSYGPPPAGSDIPTTTDLPETETEEPVVLVEDDDDDTESVISIAVSYDGDNSIVPLPPTPQRIVIKGNSGKLRAIRAQPILLADGSFVYSAPAQNF